MLQRFDPLSQQQLLLFFRKLTFLLLIAIGFSLAAPQKLALVCTLLEAQCLISGAMSMTLGALARQRFDAASLTYWDEALAFSGVGLLAHVGARLLG